MTRCWCPGRGCVSLQKRSIKFDQNNWVLHFLRKGFFWEGSTEKDSVKGRSSRADVFSEKGVYKSSQCTQANTCAGVFLIKLQVFSLQRRDSGTDVSLWMLYTFFKYTSRRLLLKKQWISIKFAPIAIAMNFSCFSLFLRLVYGNLLEISMETFIQVFL